MESEVCKPFKKNCHRLTESQVEAATILYLKERTNVPVPTIFFWNSSPHNNVGAEYMVMSKV